MTASVVVNARPRLTDEPVEAIVSGCSSGQRIHVTATSVDACANVHAAWGDYAATADGTVDLAHQAPLAGSYSGADPYGLWWSMCSAGDERFEGTVEPIPTTLEVQSDGESLTTVTFTRLRIAPDIRVESIRERGLTARLFVPPAPGVPGIVVLGGSEGGGAQAEQVAALLASRGFVALAVTYFGAAGLPDHLCGVPVECVESAVAFLETRPELAGSRIGIVGSSRGAELALLVAAGCPAVSAVAAFAPSAIVWPGLAAGGAGAAAWTRNGRPLPYAVPAPTTDGASTQPSTARDAFMCALDGLDAGAPAAIPIERIAGPILLVSGDDDQLWPSDVFAEHALRRLRRARRPFADRHDRHAGAGHLSARPPGLPAARPALVHPADGRMHRLGGTRAANARAAVAAWPRAIAFLRTALTAA
jgi:dienelactone hydrolase